MSVEALAIVLHHSKASGTDKLVLLGVANHAGDGGAWPSIETLARYANTTERTVQRSVHKLVQLGELAVHRNAGGTHLTPDHKRPNRYDVLVACPATCDRTAQHRVRPLPVAPADLWITGVTPTSPGDASVASGVTPTSPEPSLEPPATDEVDTVTTGHGALTPSQLSQAELRDASERAREQLRVGLSKARARRAGGK